MSYFLKPISWNTPCAYNLYNKLIVIFEFCFVSLRHLLWLELLGCSVFAIDGACEPLSSCFFSSRCRFKCQFKDPLLSSAHVFCKSDGVLFSLNFFFFVSYYLELVLPFCFFRIFPRSIVETILWYGSFVCESQFPFDYFSMLYTFWASLYFTDKMTLHQPSLT